MSDTVTSAPTRVVRGVAEAVEAEREAYAAGEERPIGSYGVLLSIYAALVGVIALVARRRRTPVPDRIGVGDLVMAAVATHKVSRIVTKDTVTAAVRAPFTTFKEPAGHGEVNEEVRGHGLRHAIGELLTCPFCVSQWVATGFVAGFVFAPRATRLAASTFAVVTASDYLQFAHAALQKVEQ